MPTSHQEWVEADKLRRERAKRYWKEREAKAGEPLQPWLNGVPLSRIKAVDKIIGKVQEGKWKPERAEALAQKLTLPKLATTADWRQYDAGGDEISHWTLPMAVSWVAYRDIERVSCQVDAYRDRILEWEFYLYQGKTPAYDLVGIGKASIETMRKDEQHKKAEKLLWAALSTGKLFASAKDAKTAKRVDLPPIDWIELIPFKWGLAFQGNKSEMVYTDALIEREEVLRLWAATIDDRSAKEAVEEPAVVCPAGSVEDGIRMLEEQDALFLKDKGERWSHHQWTQIASHMLNMRGHVAAKAWETADLSDGFRQRRRATKQKADG